MFGQHDQPQNDTIPDQVIDNALQADNAGAPPPADNPAPQNTPSEDNQAWAHPGTPINGEKTITPTNHPAPNASQPGDDQTVDHPAPAADTNDLIDIKQKALHQLSPLVGHLDQSPEEKFRTTMMMIQASDDHSLVKDAYEAAGQIQDEKARAQALLDIVNEINYFTQTHHS